MHSDSSSFKVPLRIGGLAVLAVLCTSVAYAAPRPHRAAPRRACVPHATAKKLAPRMKAYGPVALPSSRALAGLVDTTASSLKRGTCANRDDDDEAIQNDAP